MGLFTRVPPVRKGRSRVFNGDTCTSPIYERDCQQPIHSFFERTARFSLSFYVFKDAVKGWGNFKPRRIISLHGFASMGAW